MKRVSAWKFITESEYGRSNTLQITTNDRTILINRPPIDRGKNKGQISTTFRGGLRLLAYRHKSLSWLFAYKRK